MNAFLLSPCSYSSNLNFTINFFRVLQLKRCHLFLNTAQDSASLESNVNVYLSFFFIPLFGSPSGSCLPTEDACLPSNNT